MNMACTNSGSNSKSLETSQNIITNHQQSMLQRMYKNDNVSASSNDIVMKPFLDDSLDILKLKKEHTNDDVQQKVNIKYNIEKISSNNNEYISEFTRTDVLFGRGGLANCHEGNKRFRELVAKYRPEYVQVIKVKKPDVARLVVAEVKNSTPPGRFLKREENSGRWYVVSDRNATEKTSQALREKNNKEKKATGRFIERNEKTGKWSIVEDEVHQGSENGQECEDQPDAIGSCANVEAELRIEKIGFEDETSQSPGKHDNLKHAEDIGSSSFAPTSASTQALLNIVSGLPNIPPNSSSNVIVGNTHLPSSQRPSNITNSNLHSILADLHRASNLPKIPPYDFSSKPLEASYPLLSTFGHNALPQNDFYANAALRYSLEKNMMERVALAIEVEKLKIEQSNASSNGPSTLATIVSNKKSRDDKDSFVLSPKRQKASITTGKAFIARKSNESDDDYYRCNAFEKQSNGESQGMQHSAETHESSQRDKSENQTEESPRQHVSNLTKSDVLFGRGGLTNCHDGNKKFRELVTLHRPEYVRAIKVKKPSVARIIVTEVKKLSPTGRFLKRDDKSQRWYVMSDRHAAEKASQALREKCPKDRKKIIGEVKINECLKQDKSEASSSDSEISKGSKEFGYLIKKINAESVTSTQLAKATVINSTAVPQKIESTSRSLTQEANKSKNYSIQTNYEQNKFCFICRQNLPNDANFCFKCGKCVLQK